MLQKLLHEIVFVLAVRRRWNRRSFQFLQGLCSWESP